MSKKTGGGIGLFGILFWLYIIYNLFFSNDDADDKKAVIVDNSSPEISEQLKESFADVKKDIINFTVEAKKEFDSLKVEIGEDLERKKKKEKDEIINRTQDKKSEQKEDKLNSLDNESEPKTKMKKL